MYMDCTIVPSTLEKPGRIYAYRNGVKRFVQQIDLETEIGSEANTSENITREVALFGALQVAFPEKVTTEKLGNAAGLRVTMTRTLEGRKRNEVPFREDGRVKAWFATELAKGAGGAIVRGWRYIYIADTLTATSITYTGTRLAGLSINVQQAIKELEAPSIPVRVYGNRTFSIGPQSLNPPHTVCFVPVELRLDRKARGAGGPIAESLPLSRAATEAFMDAELVQ
jgi:hypothetical protein